MVLLSFPLHKRSKCLDHNGQFVKFYSALLKRLLNRSGSPYSDLKGKIDRRVNSRHFILPSSTALSINIPLAWSFKFIMITR